jgi:hypothetical protein
LCGRGEGGGEGVEILQGCHAVKRMRERSGLERVYVLEGIRACLPFPPDLDSDFDGLVDVLCSTLIVDAELEDVAVFDRMGSGFGIGLAQPDVVQEGAGAALGVLDIETGGFDPYFCMGAGDDLGLERELVGTERVDGGEAETGSVGETTDAEGGIALAEFTRDGFEAERATRVELGDEADAVGGGGGGWCGDGEAGWDDGAC